MPVLNQALAAQAPQTPAIDPVGMLMKEYERLTADDGPAKPMFTPEQANERVARNDTLAGLGVLGGLSGDRGVGRVGGQVLKQALADRDERHTDRGIVNPLTGEQALDPEYSRARREQQRATVLQRALAFQQSQQASNDRRDIATDRTQTMRDIAADREQNRLAIKAMGNAAGGGGGGKPPNLVQVKDDATGKIFLMDPKTGENRGEFKNQDGTSFTRPDRPSGGDEKELTGIMTGKSAAKMAVEAVTKHPDAFGPVKGAPDMLGQGMIGGIARYVRDNKSLTQDQIAARSIIYNNVSQIIKERAGTAQSQQELKRLQGFLPSELDNAPAIIAKMTAFDKFLDEKGIAVRSKYAGPRPMQHMGGPVPIEAPQAAPAGATKRLKFNPTTGDLE